MKKINFGARETDLERISIIKALYPNPANTTEAIRLAIAAYIRNADPVALSEARKAVSKARKQEATK
jgi:hypothetical protein